MASAHPESSHGFTTRIPLPNSGAPLLPPTYPFLLPPVQPDEIGRLGNYRVLRLLGKGGMGLVFHAEDIALRRPVALKVMKPELDGNPGAWQRFLREARAMASIKHDSLVTVFQVGQEQEHVYLAMELLEGLSLEGWLAQVGQPQLPALLQVARQIASGLAAIHRGGLIHRDLKPANLWREEPSGRVKILDFGLARFVNDDAGLTQSGTVLGTPAFMSPEQARGEQVDPRTDLFSFGCVLYVLCTGTSPFHGPSTSAALTALALHNPVPVDQLNPAIPRALSDLVMQLLAKNPVDRPCSAEAVLERLQRIDSSSAESGSTRQIAPEAPSSEQTAALPADLARQPKASRPWVKVAAVIGLAVFVGIVVPWAVSSSLRSGARGASASQVRSFSSEVSPDDQPSRLPEMPTAVTAAVRIKEPPPETTSLSPKMAPTETAPVQPKPTPTETAPIRPKTLPASKAAPVWVYLSELQPIDKVYWPFTPPRPPPMPPMQGFGPGPGNGENLPPQGKPSGAVCVKGKDSPHGIFMHPPAAWEGSASLTYQLPAAFTTFRAMLSLNDGPPRSEAPFTFAVYGDNRLLWKSRPLSSQAEAQTCTVSVKGVARLKIEVRSEGEPRGAHAVWIEPYLTR